MLGIDVAESTVSKYLGKAPRPPSQSWRTFVRNHLHQSIAIDFAVVPTIRFSLLYVCVVLDHGRRRILHVNVTANPTAAWAAQQVVEALPWETDAGFLFRDGDGIYGEEFTRRVTGLGLQQLVTARASPWQNAYCERVIGTLRRECLYHVVAINERVFGDNYFLHPTTITFFRSPGPEPCKFSDLAHPCVHGDGRTGKAPETLAAAGIERGTGRCGGRDDRADSTAMAERADAVA